MFQQRLVLSAFLYNCGLVFIIKGSQYGLPDKDNWYYMLSSLFVKFKNAAFQNWSAFH